MEYVETRTPDEIARDKKAVADYLDRRYAGPPRREPPHNTGDSNGTPSEITPGQAFMQRKYGGPQPKR